MRKMRHRDSAMKLRILIQLIMLVQMPMIIIIAKEILPFRCKSSGKDHTVTTKRIYRNIY